MTNLTLWVLLMPLLGFIILGLLGRIMSRRGILVVALGASGLAFLFTAISFFSMLGTTPASARFSDQVFYTWINSGVTVGIAPLTISFGLLFDPLSAIMLMVVTGVGFLIHIYSVGYMEEDPGFWRFFCYMNFFIFAMTLLVSADNFLFLFIGWGLVGLASFLLIGFWYQRRSAVAAAQKALVINIIGDFGLMIAIFLIFKHYGALNYFTNGTGNVGVFNQVTAGGIPTISTTIICLLLFLAAGAVIHSLGGEQDMRAMGGLRYRLKVTFWTFLIGALAISGIPPLAGFWSKDDILSSLLAYATSGGGLVFYLLWGMGILTAGLTAFYMFRLFFGIFAGGYRGTEAAENAGEEEEEDTGHSHRPSGDYEIYESPAIMTVPMIILAVLSIVGGFIGSFALFGDASLHPFTTFLNPVFTNPTWTNVPVA